MFIGLFIYDWVINNGWREISSARDISFNANIYGCQGVFSGVCPCLCVRVQLSKQFFSNKGCGAGRKEEVKTAQI